MSDPAPSGPNVMLWGLVAAFILSAFLGGYLVGSGTESVSNEDLAKIITQTRQTQAQQAPDAPVFVSLDDDPSKGNPEAAVTIVEFSDFQCPSCNRFYQQVLPQLERHYIDTGKINFVYRDMPLNIHANAVPAHAAAECAHEQGMFWQYHDILFERQSQWNRLDAQDLDAQLKAYAAELGLDSGFDECIKSPDVIREIQKDFAQARGYGAQGTPTFFVGNDSDGYIKLAGVHPFSTFQSMIDSKL